MGSNDRAQKSVEAMTAAQAFSKELMSSVETISGIEETHGVATLVDLIHLQSAILNNEKIQYFIGDDSRIADFILDYMPNGHDWLDRYVEVIDDTNSPTLSMK